MLWRIESGRAAPVARAESSADGELIFPPLPLPRRGIELRAAPEGASPWGHEASARIRLIRPTLFPAPRGRVRLRADGTAEVELWGLRPGETVLLADGAGRLRARLRVRIQARAARVGLRLLLENLTGADLPLRAAAAGSGKTPSRWRLLPSDS